MNNEVIKFFIGTDVNGGCAYCQMVLEYSIKKHCSLPYEIYWMKLSDDPNSMWGGWNTENFYTPFSPFRYAIPEFMNFKGKAIYQDDDQLWLSDPKELWDIKLNEGMVMTGKYLQQTGEIRHCVSLIDCEQFGKYINIPVQRRKQNANFAEIMKTLTRDRTQIIDDNFNNYDGEFADLKDIKVLHFTNMSQNPGVAMMVERLGDQKLHWYDGPIRKHRRQDCVDIFKQYYEEAVADGFKVENYLPEKRLEYKIHSNAGYTPNNGFDN